jgi:hypothetical protein
MLLVGGELEDVQYLTYGPSAHHFDLVRKAYIERHRAWVELLKKNVNHPEKVLTFEQSSGAAYPVAYLLKSYDLAQTKTWGRQNVEVNVANNRGACRSYDRPMMLADDPWVGDLWFTRSPEEMEQVFYLGYFSGADYLYHEYPLLVPVGEQFQPNRWGQKYLAFARFTARHPRRGEQIVRLAVMRGFGDAWDKIYTQFTPGAWGDPKNRATNNETIRDYHLLEVFFPHFGAHYQTDPYRLCTGTPFGPVDLVPWDTPLAKLRTYDLLIYCGLNAMDEEQYFRLKSFVQQGGTLVLTVGQLRTEGKEPRAILPAARHDELLGVTLEKLPPAQPGPRPLLFGRMAGTVQDYCAVTITEGKTLARTQSGAPVIIKHEFGQGQVYLYASEFLSAVDDSVNLSFFAALARPAKLLAFDPASDWLEYTAWQKGKILMLHLFNHGRMKSPSGNGPDLGPWRGTLTLAFEKFPDLRGQKLEAYLVEFADPKFRFSPVPLAVRPQSVSLRVAVDHRAEIILGPKGLTKDQFFSRR